MPGKEVLATAKWNSFEIMYEKRLLILVHQAYYHLLPCAVNCLFEKYISSYDLGSLKIIPINRLKQIWRFSYFVKSDSD